MSAEQTSAAGQQGDVTRVEKVSLLEEAINATKQTERSRAEDLLKTLTEEALKGTVTWSRNVTQTINSGIKAIDQVLSKQLAGVLHHPELQKLEGSWRGLTYLVMNRNTGA